MKSVKSRKSHEIIEILQNLMNSVKPFGDCLAVNRLEICIVRSGNSGSARYNVDVESLAAQESLS